MIALPETVQESLCDYSLIRISEVISMTFR